MALCLLLPWVISHLLLLLLLFVFGFVFNYSSAFCILTWIPTWEKIGSLWLLKNRRWYILMKIFFEKANPWTVYLICIVSFKPHSRSSRGYHFCHGRNGENVKEQTPPCNQAGFQPPQTCLLNTQGLVPPVGLKPGQVATRGLADQPKASFQMWTLHSLFGFSRTFVPSLFTLLMLWEAPCAIRLHIDESTPKDRYAQASLAPGTWLVFA